MTSSGKPEVAHQGLTRPGYWMTLEEEHIPQTSFINGIDPFIGSVSLVCQTGIIQSFIVLANDIRNWVWAPNTQTEEELWWGHGLGSHFYTLSGKIEADGRIMELLELLSVLQHNNIINSSSNIPSLCHPDEWCSNEPGSGYAAVIPVSVCVCVCTCPSMGMSDMYTQALELSFEDALRSLWRSRKWWNSSLRKLQKQKRVKGHQLDSSEAYWALSSGHLGTGPPIKPDLVGSTNALDVSDSNLVLLISPDVTLWVLYILKLMLQLRDRI